jgi:hypothetical protein
MNKVHQGKVTYASCHTGTTATWQQESGKHATTPVQGGAQLPPGHAELLAQTACVAAHQHRQAIQLQPHDHNSKQKEMQPT